MNPSNDITLYVLENNLLPFCQEYNHEILAVDVNHTIDHVYALLTLSGMSERLKSSILFGYTGVIKADAEFGTGERGLQTMYEGHQIHAAHTYAERYVAGERRVEVGMKYPQFNVNAFKRAFRPLSDQPILVESRGGTKYEMHTDRAGNVFTFDPNRMGEGGYAGAIFINEDEAFRFVEFLMGNAAHYVKDLDIGYNGLGGLDIRDFDNLASGPVITIQAPAVKLLGTQLSTLIGQSY